MLLHWRWQITALFHLIGNVLLLVANEQHTDPSVPNQFVFLCEQGLHLKQIHTLLFCPVQNKLEFSFLSLVHMPGVRAAFSVQNLSNGCSHFLSLLLSLCHLYEMYLFHSQSYSLPTSSLRYLYYTFFSPISLIK